MLTIWAGGSELQENAGIYQVATLIFPLLSNLYLNGVDRMMERTKEVIRHGKFTYVKYARHADDLAILVDSYPNVTGC